MNETDGMGIGKYLQLKYNSPIRLEEHVCQAGSMHSKKDVAVVSHLLKYKPQTEATDDHKNKDNSCRISDKEVNDYHKMTSDIVMA